MHTYPKSTALHEARDLTNEMIAKYDAIVHPRFPVWVWHEREFVCPVSDLKYLSVSASGRTLAELAELVKMMPPVGMSVYIVGDFATMIPTEVVSSLGTRQISRTYSGGPFCLAQSVYYYKGSWRSFCTASYFTKRNGSYVNVDVTVEDAPFDEEIDEWGNVNHMRLNAPFTVVSGQHSRLSRWYGVDLSSLLSHIDTKNSL